MKIKTMEAVVVAPSSLSSSEGSDIHSRYALEAIRLLNENELHRALHFLNLCLDNTNDVVPPESGQQKKNDDEGKNGNNDDDDDDDDSKSSEKVTTGISPADEVSLLEKRCLIHMKLSHFDDVLNDARRILDKRTDYSLAYKCLLVALCKTSRLEQVTEILKLWRTTSPQDLDMMECRTKLEALINAVKNGIECKDAFSNIEDQLGLSYDWLLARKLQDPRWRYRPLPPGMTSLTLCLPFRFGHCSLGAKCPDAHGSDELEEWKSRNTLKTVSMLLDTIKLGSGERYIRRILEQMEEVGDSSKIFSEVLPEWMKIRCSKPLEAVVATTENMKVYKWTFAVESKNPISHVCLLDDLHREYFFISLAVIYGATNKINLINDSSKDVETQIVEISSPTALALTGKKNYFTYKIDVKFKPNIYGTFRQNVIFDVGQELKIVRKLVVEVVPPDDSTESGGDVGGETTCPSPTFDESSSFQVGGTWNFGNADIVCGFTGDKVAASKLGFALINGSKPEGLPSTLSEPLNKHQYKEIMRYFLTQEERSRQEILAKYNLTAPLNLMENYVMTSGFNEGLTRYSVDKSLYGRMTLFRDVSEDTAVGRLILRSCNYLLLTRTEEARKATATGRPKVYLCPISDKTKNNIYIDVGTTCVKELNLKDKDVAHFDIQFQLDRTAFMEMKAVIDKLQDFHLDMLFPDFGMNHHIPWSPIKQWGDEPDAKVKLNPRQKESLIAITSEAPRIPPILVIGPFGTGKTFTLAQCIHKLLLQPNVRIMVCTHSNSAADLYIKEYLDPWVQEGFTAAKPLRIYYHLRNLNSVHPDVIQYCIIENLRFRPPTYEEILAHKVIVVTLSTSYILMQMDLPPDTFSHILLDEAAQAMESEAVTPLMCAGADTKLVLAGDHMQLSPELFSEEAKSLHPSLLERLHNYYPDAHPCKLMLCENYRSHSSIIDYVSDEFYNKRLQCSMVQPVHDTFYPLTFFSARGEEVQEMDSTSYYNTAEVFEIVDKVTKLVSSWPESWGSYRNESAIGVLTPYSDQVSRIRHALRKKGLYSVSVERVLNVQGKQFRAVFLSTVRSFRPWVKVLPEAVGNEVDLGFFSNPKLLNTALTRAQSLVAVVGDPVSLCSEGKCRNLWKDFINVCHKNKSLYGISFTQLEQNILGLEMRVTWGLNPLADVFEPKARSTDQYTNNSPTAVVVQPTNYKVLQAHPSPPSHGATPSIPSQYNNTTTANPFSSPPNPNATTSKQQQQHLMAQQQQQQHRPISPGYNQGHNPPMWGGGPLVQSIVPQQPGLVQPPGLVGGVPQLQTAPPYNIGYHAPVFPPGGGGPHVMFPHQMGGGYPGPPIPPINAHGMGMVVPPAHLRMSIPPRSGGSRFPPNNAEIGGHHPHLPMHQHHLPPQNMMPLPLNRPHYTPTPQQQQQFDPVMKNSPSHQYNEEQQQQRINHQQQQQVTAAGPVRFSNVDAAIINNSRQQQQQQNLQQNQPYRLQQPPPPQPTLSQEQYVAGLPLYHNNLISETLQQQNNVSAPPPPQVSNSQLNFHDLGIAHLPLSELLHLQQMLERFAVTNGHTEEIQNLFSKVREAIYIARGGIARSSSGVPTAATARHEVQQQTPSSPPVPPLSAVNRNIWASTTDNNTLQQAAGDVHLNTSRIASIAQQLSEVQIAEAADNIWANLGFSDGTSTTEDHHHQNQQHSLLLQNRRTNNISPLMMMQDSNIPSSSSSYGRSSRQHTESQNHATSRGGGFDGVVSHNSWSPSASAAAHVQSSSSGYGSLTAQISSNDNFPNARQQQQEHFDHGVGGGGGSGPGRSYANVARRAALPSANAVGGPTSSAASLSGLYNMTNNESSSVPPYPFNYDDAQILLQQQQAKRNKRPQ